MYCLYREVYFLWVYIVLLNSQSTDEITLDPVRQQLSTETGWGCIICFTHYENWSLSKLKLYSLASWYQRKKGWKRREKTLQKHVRCKKTAQVNQSDRHGTHKEVIEARTRGVTKTPYWKAKKNGSMTHLINVAELNGLHICWCCVCMYYSTQKQKIGFEMSDKNSLKEQLRTRGRDSNPDVADWI